MRIIFMGTPDFAVPTLEALVAARVGADRAGVGGIDVAAGGTGLEPFVDRLQRGPQGTERCLALLEQVEHRAARRPRPEAGEARERLGQGFDFGRGHDGTDRGLRRRPPAR